MSTEGKYPIKVNEERTIERLTFSRIIKSIREVFDLEKGVLLTLKLLFLKPGELMRMYLFEGRFRIYNPFRLLVFTTAINIFLLYYIDIESMFQPFAEGLKEGASSSDIEINAVADTMRDYYNILLWLFIPIFGLLSYRFNKSKGYNFAEHLTMQTFHVVALNCITILFFPLSAYYSYANLSMLIMLLGAAYYFWLLASWLKSFSLMFFVKNLFAYGIAFILYGILILIIVTLIAVF